jgi:uncharacterized protein (TIGR02646 family)
MMRISKREEPEWYKELLKKDSSIRKYADLSADDKQRLSLSFLDEQFYICGYCCGNVGIGNAHNEHIVPQSRCKGQESLDYDNMIASCNAKETCGHGKNREYDEKEFISPLERDCERHYKYTIDGAIVGIDEKAKYTIELLNLNSGPLKNARRNILKQSFNCKNDLASEIYLKPHEGKLQPFCNIVKFFLGRHADLFGGAYG